MIDQHTPADHIAEHEAALAASIATPWKGSAEPSAREEAEAEMLARTDTGDMVRQVTNQLDRVTARLAEHRGYNADGSVNYVVAEDSLARRSLELQWNQLANHTLPATRLRAEEIAARKAALPSAEQKLQAEADRRARIEAAAINRVEAMEVEERAAKLLAERRRVANAGGV